MGCQLGKAGEHMRVVNSQTSSTVSDNKVPQTVVDTRLPLTAMQMFKLKKNWKGIQRQMADAGRELFVK